MINLRHIIVGAASLAALAAATGASAQSTATATGTASVTIIAPITLGKSVDMEFGKVVPPGGSTPGTVTVSYAGGSLAVTSSTGTKLLGGITRTAAKFTVGGTAGQAYTLTLPSTTVAMSGGGLTLTGFTSYTAGSGTISSTATDNDIYVGATLNVPATVTAGAYSGTFAVSVAYN